MKGRHLQAKVKSSQMAYDFILNAIFKGELKAGAAVTEEWLGGHLKMSRTPAREALIRLLADGILTDMNNRATVTTITPVDIKEIFELRLLLEPYAASLCVGIIDRDLVRKIRKHTETLLEKPEDDHSRSPYEIHDLILESTRNRRLIAITKNLQSQIRRVITLGWNIPGLHRRSLEEHLPILDAILNDDRAMAETHMRQHLRNVMNDMLDQEKFHFVFRE
jgi:DNA-binding GntR family transcriptional regulator